MINIADIYSVLFRKSTVYENSLDLVVDYGLGLQLGDYQLPKFSDGLVIYDPVLHAALRQQASIMTVGNAYDGKFLYVVTYKYFNDKRFQDTFVDIDKHSGISNVEYNRNLFKGF